MDLLYRREESLYEYLIHLRCISLTMYDTYIHDHTIRVMYDKYELSTCRGARGCKMSNYYLFVT